MSPAGLLARVGIGLAVLAAVALAFGAGPARADDEVDGQPDNRIPRTNALFFVEDPDSIERAADGRRYTRVGVPITACEAAIYLDSDEIAEAEEEARGRGLAAEQELAERMRKLPQPGKAKCVSEAYTVTPRHAVDLDRVAEDYRTGRIREWGLALFSRARHGDAPRLRATRTADGRFAISHVPSEVQP